MNSLSTPNPSRFAAIDFETADYGRDSACALAVVVVESENIIYQESTLIRPPRRDFVFTHIHGITWQHVAKKQSFADIWPSIHKRLDELDIHYFAAHNASFDKSVLNACCERIGAGAPQKDFLCTVKLARKVWNIFPTKLSDVCNRLSISLNHHEALSDALACAKIVIEAEKNGFDVKSMISKKKPVRTKMKS